MGSLILPKQDVSSTLPAFMQDETEMGTELVTQYVRPPRFKVVDNQSKEPYDAYPPGTLLIAPDLVVIGEAYGDEFEKILFTPILFWPEYIAWNPLESKGTLPSIRERSTDPRSKLARKCMNQESWFEEFEDTKPYGKPVRNCEHLNFLCLIHDKEPTLGLPVVLSYARGDHELGTRLASFIRLRRAPIYANIFEGQVGLRKNSKGRWFNMIPAQPSGPAFVEDEGVYKQLREMHLKLKDAYEGSVLRPDYDDPDSTGDETTVENSEF